jgi:heme-degrading monooxygenase HmoA
MVRQMGDGDMVFEYVRYTIPPERSEEFEKAYARAASALAASEHCLGWELSRCVEAPEHYILRLAWDSLEGHEQGFRSSAQFRDFLAAVGPFVGSIDEMHHYTMTSTLSK